MNICEYTKMIHDKKIHFSPEELSEMAEMKKVSIEALDCLENLKKNAPEEVQRIADLEQQMDDMTESYRTNQTKRMQEGKCSDEACILYSEMLTDFERIGDHILNIGQEMGLGKVSA